MWLIRSPRSSRICHAVFFIVSVTLLYLTFYSSQFPSGSIFKPAELEEIEAENSFTEYLSIRIDLTSTTAICRADDYLIIYILSSVTNIERRNVIRSTWGSKQTGVCFAFILGKARGATSELQMKISNERREQKDIVQVDHFESYRNVVYKEVAALRWSQYFYPNISYLFKTDDDLILDTKLVSSIVRLLLANDSNDSYLSKHSPNLQSTLKSSDRTEFFRGGWSMNYQPTLRGEGKFGVSKEIWPYPVLPIYCSGFGWLMSDNVRNRLVKASYTYPLKKTVWIGDVFLSGFLAKAANVKCTGIDIEYEQTTSANCSCSMMKNPLLTVCSTSIHAGDRSEETQIHNEYQKAWKVIQFRHDSTNITVTDC